MTRKKVDPESKIRIQVPASREQADILNAAATAAGCGDRSTWMLAHSLRAAKVDDVSHAPLVIAGAAADRLRAEARRQGVTTDQILEQLLIVTGA